MKGINRNLTYDTRNYELRVSVMPIDACVCVMFNTKFVISHKRKLKASFTDNIKYDNLKVSGIWYS